MDYMYKSSDSVIAAFEDSCSTNPEEYSHVLVVIFCILIERIKKLTKSDLVDCFLFDSMEKSIEIYLRSLNKIVKSGLTVETFALI